ncbi:ribosome-associated translation inhibitor RaiA [Altererythrobacter luteolus]|uniref:Ribosome hibernation promoting factor n=1 Tax=Pontixanthobacter luteolus TaxID=295089 RepID=A0A6I4V153_9SPHN|nr:ribosome-associated translation inhibitor RaiA [Pontixanthobacter luteolus]MXP47877.1 ribosome-associated translation inhibitor RaiA [Pontixanthobacter luteolus]
MDIRVSGHQVETGSALQTHVADRLNGIVDKYFGSAISSHVTFGKAPAGAFSCDIVTHVMHGLTVKGHAEAHDAHQALDQAAQKIDKQVRRYKRRIKDRHEQAAHASKEEEAAYTIFASAPEPEEQEEEAGGDSPLVIAETKVDIPEASVADAVMMLDLRDTNAMFFKNAGTGRHNMVYRRRDGSIGWVEPH